MTEAAGDAGETGCKRKRMSTNGRPPAYFLLLDWMGNVTGIDAVVVVVDVFVVVAELVTTSISVDGFF